MEPYPPEVEQAMTSFCRSLREHDRRRYAAVEAAKLGHGGIEYISRLLDIAPNTIRQGRRDLDGLPDRPQPRVRRPGGGRKRRIDREPELEEEFHEVLRDHTAGSPAEEHLIWTDLTAAAIAERMAERGRDVNVHVVDQLLDRHGYHRRQAQRARPLGEHPDRNDQFENIARLKREYLKTDNPILSIDTKKKELVGNFYREGRLYTQEVIRTFDHDFPSAASRVIIPHGLYDVKRNAGHVNLGTSHDTSEFACDSLERWWESQGRVLYPRASSILLLCDGGGSNSANQ